MLGPGNGYPAASAPVPCPKTSIPRDDEVVIVQAPDVHMLLNASNDAVHFIVTIGMWISIFA